MKINDWDKNQDLINQIKQLRQAGKSFRETAKALNLTSGQVAGVCHRLGIQGTNPAPQVWKKRWAFKITEEPIPPGPKTLMQLSPHDCHWVLHSKPAIYCGEPVTSDSSYCAKHLNMMLAKPKVATA